MHRVVCAVNKTAYPLYTILMNLSIPTLIHFDIPLFLLRTSFYGRLFNTFVSFYGRLVQHVRFSLQKAVAMTKKRFKIRLPPFPLTTIMDRDEYIYIYLHISSRRSFFSRQ